MNPKSVVRRPAPLLAAAVVAVGAVLSLTIARASGPSCFVTPQVSAEPCYQADFTPADPPPVALKAITDKTWWVDTDGEEPEVAGCHIEVTAADNPKRPKGGRVFGEACQPGHVLIETNPKAGEIHPHGGDKGNPFRIDCSKWCQSAKSSKPKASNGICLEAQIDVSYQGETVTCKSAKCSCN